MAIETHAAGTLADDIREQAAEHTLAANPLVGVRGQDIFDSVSTLLGKMVSSPAVAARQYLSFLGELGRILTGGSELVPDAKDKRFADPAWKESFPYRARLSGNSPGKVALRENFRDTGIHRCGKDRVTDRGRAARARTRPHVCLDAAQRSDLELLGQQLPARQRAADLRYSLLEQRHHATCGHAARRFPRPHRL